LMTRLSKILRKPVWQHLAFWAVAFVLLLKLFAEHSLWNKTDLIYTLLFLLSLIVGVYINLRILIPRFLNRKQWPLYVGLVLAVICLTVLWNEFIFEVFADWIFPGYFFISYYTYFEIAQFAVVILLLTTLIKLSKSWFELQEAQSRMMELEGVQRRTELEALRAQVNPHFLFNNLHSIYSLALTEDKSTAEVILKLSDVLRFMLYESNADQIELHKELDCIQHYFDLQKVRLQDNAEIDFHQEGDPNRLKIAPLLLMPLVENSFKHGILSSSNKTIVRGNIQIKDNQIEFSLYNRRMNKEGEPAHSGIGLQNLKRRLELIYPDKHNLKISSNDESYEVYLQLTLE
ncbi:MAG: histidine kinase, partial [Saprospiraceae bacterium]|nr:histidine kinase [Saprospiraceae bacterium]